MRKGFTFIEVLIAIAIIALLMTIAMVSLGSVRAKGRNAERASDIAVILNAVYQYAIDNNNQLPLAITTASTTICQTGAASCTGLIDLSVLTVNQKYLPSMPADPASTSTTNTNYSILKTSSGRVKIFAPSAELGTTISITR